MERHKTKEYKSAVFWFLFLVGIDLDFVLFVVVVDDGVRSCCGRAVDHSAIEK